DPAVRGRVRGLGRRPGPGHRPAAQRRSCRAVRGSGGQRAEILVAGRGAAPGHRRRLRRGPGPRRRADHRLALAARHHPGGAAQIARNLDRYEREWAAAHPYEVPGRALRRGWDARAWADGRPDKVAAQAGTSLEERWRAQLYGLGYRDPERPADLRPPPIGAL